MAHDASFKDILGSIAKERNITVSSSFKVGKLPLEIDLVMEMQTNTDFSMLQPLKEVFERSGCNRLIIEFKSRAEGLTISHIRKLIAYRHLYLITEDPWDSKRTSHLIIIVSSPRKLLKKLDVQPITKGIYKFSFDRSECFMIVANELEMSRENLGLAIFTSSIRKSRKLIEILLQIPEEERFLSFFMVVNYGTAIKVLKEKGMSSGSIISRNIRMAINDLGLKYVIDEIGLENVIKEIGISKIIEVVNPTDLAQNLPFDMLMTILKELPEEEKKKLVDELMSN